MNSLFNITEKLLEKAQKMSRFFAIKRAKKQFVHVFHALSIKLFFFNANIFSTEELPLHPILHTHVALQSAYGSLTTHKGDVHCGQLNQNPRSLFGRMHAMCSGPKKRESNLTVIRSESLLYRVVSVAVIIY